LAASYEEEDIHRAVEAEAEKGGDHNGGEAADPAEFGELDVQGHHQQLGRNNHGEQRQGEHHVFPPELEPGEAVGDEGAGEQMSQGAAQYHDQVVLQGMEKIQMPEGVHIILKIHPGNHPLPGDVLELEIIFQGIDQHCQKGVEEDKDELGQHGVDQNFQQDMPGPFLNRAAAVPELSGGECGCHPGASFLYLSLI